MMSSRYSEEQLKSMAKTVIDDYESNGSRSLRLIFIVSAATGLTPNQVRDRIREMAGEETSVT